MQTQKTPPERGYVACDNPFVPMPRSARLSLSHPGPSASLRHCKGNYVLNLNGWIRRTCDAQRTPWLTTWTDTKKPRLVRGFVRDSISERGALNGSARL